MSVFLAILSVVCRLLAWTCRILAILFAVICIALCFGPVASLTPIANLAYWLQEIVYDGFSGLFVWISPFGGSFRGDFALASVILFVLDWALMRASVALRR